jgi:hypothetical protein
MIARAVLCPSPPLLAPGVSGQTAVLPDLREACEAAVAWLLAAAPDAVTVIGPATTTVTWRPESAPDLTMHAPALNRLAALAADTCPGGGTPKSDCDNSKKPRYGDASARSPRLPLALAIGVGLLDAVGYCGPRVLQSVAASASPDACSELGRDLAADAPGTALLVIGDGSARRSAAAPGYLDERAEPFDAAVEQAVRDGDLPALAALDPELAADLLAAGRPAWQVLVGALATPDAEPPARPRTRILYSDAPLGVTYLVATLEPAATR